MGENFLTLKFLLEYNNKSLAYGFLINFDNNQLAVN